MGTETETDAGAGDGGAQETGIEARVVRGAAFLDTRFVDWWGGFKINLESLDIARSCFCILGQLYGSYFESASRLKPHWQQWPCTSYAQGCFDCWATSHGFTPSGIVSFREEADALTEAWRTLISDRRGI